MIAPAGRRLGKYEIRGKLGRGGMADVYLAVDTENGAQVALKLIEYSHESDSDTRDAIEAERCGAALQAQLAAVDPRVTRVYAAGDLDGYFYVAMEYIDGEDLAEIMRRGRLPLELAVDHAINVAGALENAHNLEVASQGKSLRGIVHGDIKPKNIRVDTHGRLRVLDFGIAKALSLSRKLTRNEFGSVPYASPERLESGEVDALSDLWSLAVMLHEMVTGLQPYQASSTEQLERMIRSGIAPPPAPDPCPDALRRILMKAMATDRILRYQTAHEFAADLEAFRKGEPVRAVTEDLDATRRTVRREEPDDSTRRTMGREEPDEATRRTPPRPPEPGDETRQSPRPNVRAEWSSVAPRRFGRFPKGVFGRAALFALGILALYLAWNFFSSWRLYDRGREFQRQVETEKLTALPAIWDKWTELSQGHSSSWLLHGARGAARRKFVEEAERVITAYREDSRQLYEGDWERSRTWLSHALELDPDDTVRGNLRLCEGHLARINGTVHRSSADLNAAVLDFEEARKLLPKSPDPLLGLARVYVYGLKDIDKAYDALKLAELRNYRLGNRDKSQLADGYRDRADRLWWDSRNIRGLPQEKDQIQRAAQDYQKALGLYQGVAPYGNSAVQIVRVQADLDSVNTRLQQLALESGGPA